MSTDTPSPPDVSARSATVAAEPAPAHVTAAATAPARLLVAPSRQVLTFLLGALIAYWACFFIRDGLAQFSSIDWTKAGSGDAAVDWQAARLFWRGISPYSPEGLKAVGVDAFGHPPTTPFWFLPLYELDHPTFAELMGLLNLGLTFALAGIVVFTLGWPLPWLWTALVFGIVQSLPPALEHARVIQISVWIAFAYALAWRWLRQGRDVSAGIVLGLSCTLKFFPGLLCVYLLLARRFRALLAATLAFGAVAGLMTWRFGLASWPLFFSQQGSIAARWLTDVRNGSLHGILRRAFARQCEDAPLNDPRATLLIALVSLGLLGVALWLWYRARARQPAQSVFDRSFALFSVLSAFLNPWIWEHYFYLLVLPALLGWHYVLTDLARVYRAWANGERPSSSLLLPSAGALLAALPTYAAYLAYQNVYRTNNGARIAACGPMPNRELQHWMLVQARYFETINWLPWASFVLLLLGLLMYRTRPRAAGDVSG